MRAVRNILFCLGCVFSFNASAQWDLVYQNDSLSFRDIHFFDADTGYVMGIHAFNSDGVLIKTFDGGQNWDTTYFPGKYFWSMDFPSRDTGYISFTNPSQFNVMRTIDGGNTWQQTTNNIINGNMPMSIDFYNNIIGVLSAGGYSWKTIDAGINWNLITTNPDGGEPKIHINDSVLVGAAGNFVVYSFDSCSAYDYTIVYPNASGTSVFTKDGNICLSAVGQNGATYGYGHSNYGVIAIGDVQTMLFDVIHFPYPQMYQMRDICKTDNFYYAVGYPFNDTIGSYFLKSTDGINWFRQESSEPGGVQIAWIEQLFCLNDSVCYAYGGGRIYKTTNGGGPMLQSLGVHIVGIGENEIAEQMTLFPNPSNGYFQIELESSINLQDEIEVYNLLGEKVFSKNISVTNGKNIFQLNVGNLESGIYLVKLRNQNFSTKMVIQR